MKELTFNHIGVACFDIVKTAELYQTFGYKAGEVIVDSLQNVKVCVLEKEGMPMIELLGPVDEKSPICNVLKKSGATPYHICYNAADIEETTKELRNQRFMPVTPIKYSNVFNTEVCFLIHKDMGLIELLKS